MPVRKHVKRLERLEEVGGPYCPAGIRFMTKKNRDSEDS